MYIVAKSIISKEQIAEKLRQGINKIELQLMKDYLNNINNIEIFNTIKKTGCDILTIHMPLIEKGEELNLEYFTYANYSKVFMKVCELAEMFAIELNHKVLIVIHNGFSLDSYNKMPSLLFEIENLFKNVLNIYKNILFSFENVCPMVEKQDRIFTRNGFLFDNVDMANYFNNVFNTNVFGTTLDTCHILTTQKVLEYYKECDIFNMEDIALKNYFSKNKDTLNNIHLCNLTNKGLKPMEHGSAFELSNKKDVDFVREFVRIYKELNLNAYVTLEIIEKDYLNCINLRKTKECLEYIMREI